MKKRLLTGFGGGAVTCRGLKYINTTKQMLGAMPAIFDALQHDPRYLTSNNGHRLLIGGACDPNISLGMPIVLSATKPLCLHKPVAVAPFALSFSVFPSLHFIYVHLRQSRNKSGIATFTSSPISRVEPSGTYPSNI